MCCLFGILDYKRNLSLKQRKAILTVLSAECEVRGTDATGIAYVIGKRLKVHKAPKPASHMKFYLPESAHYIMGHTRMTTQGSELLNYNNHPFKGKAGSVRFALAHNGVLYNEEELRQVYHLPDTKIETDSYVAVQLLEQKKTLDFDALKQMAELCSGTFTFTVLDGANSLYIVKGNNPMCIYHFPQMGFYLYASTEEILKTAVNKLRLNKLHLAKVQISMGEILKITANGSIERAAFDIDAAYLEKVCSNGWKRTSDISHYAPALWDCTEENEDYWDALLCYGERVGVSEDTMDILLESGYSLFDIEEMLYDKKLLHESLQEAMYLV